MMTRAVKVGWVVLVAMCLAPPNAGAQGAIHSLLDPVHLAADFAPAGASPLEVRPFERAATDSAAGPADSIRAALRTTSGSATPPLASPPAPADERLTIVGPILGASVGEVFLMPAGAHLGNGSKGSYWSALGGSALGFLATLALSYAGPVGTMVGVAVQVALTVSGERRSAKRKAAERAAVPVDAVR